MLSSHSCLRSGNSVPLRPTPLPFSRPRPALSLKCLHAHQQETKPSVEVSERVEMNGNELLKGSEMDEDSFQLDPPGLNDDNRNRVSRYQAARSSFKVVQEGNRPLSEYMALPVSQYSVLDAEKIERIEEDKFRVETGAVGFLGFRLTPILTLSVKAHDTGCEVSLLDCKLAGNKAVEDANSRFACQMRNFVSHYRDPKTQEMKITGECSLKVAGIVPGWVANVFPISMINNLGNKMLSQILRIAMPRFLDQLENDYSSWAEGDDSREALGTGEFSMTESNSSDSN